MEKLIASVVQLVERWSPKPNVAGSSPAWRANASVAQLVEQLICIQLVAGSIPVGSSK